MTWRLRLITVLIAAALAVVTQPQPSSIAQRIALAAKLQTRGEHESRTPAQINGVCIDRSASYNPSQSLREAVHTISTQIAAIPSSSSPVHTVFIWTISDNTYRPEELRIRIQISGVPSKPTPPNPNPISPDDTLRKLQQYRQDLKKYEHGLATAQQQARTGARAILHLTLPVENKSTDVWGCLQRASEAQVTTLTIASDMNYNGIQQEARRHSLPNVKVRVIDYRCGDSTHPGNQAQLCEDREDFWRRAFATAGSRDVEFFFPGQPVGNLLTR